MSTQEEIAALYKEREGLQSRLEIATQQQVAYQQSVAALEVQSPAAAATWGVVGPEAGDVKVVAVDQQTMTQGYERATPPPESPATLQAQINEIDGKIDVLENRQAIENGLPDHETAKRAELLELTKEALEHGEGLKEDSDQWKKAADDITHLPGPVPPDKTEYVTNATAKQQPQDLPGQGLTELAGADLMGAVAVVAVGKVIYDKIEPTVRELGDKAAELANDAKEYATAVSDKLVEGAKATYEWANDKLTVDKEGKQWADLTDKQTKELEAQTDRHAQERADLKADSAEMMARFQEQHKGDSEGQKAINEAKLRDAATVAMEDKVAKQATEHQALLAEQAAAREALAAKLAPEPQAIEQRPPPPPPQPELDWR
jgi:hypothetical protein